jgi:uncharacterized protein YjaG (DUF416 family)
MDAKTERMLENLKTRCGNLEAQGEVDYKTILKLVDRVLLHDQMLIDAAARIKELQDLIGGMQGIVTGIMESVEAPEETDGTLWN